MSFSHTILRNWQRGQDNITQKEVVEADSELNLDIPASHDGTTHAVAAIDVSQLKSLYISTDQDITIKTNSSGSPDDTISLKANIPLMWSEDCGFTCPLSTDVTGLYFVNASSTNANVQVRALIDSTP